MRRLGLIPTLLLSFAVVFALAIYGDIDQLFQELTHFPIEFWLITLSLSMSNYFIRFIRWHYLLSLLSIRIDISTSILVFTSGLGMSMSPGRIGELAKSYFLKNRKGIPVILSSAVIITERITDLIAVIFLSAGGLLLIPGGLILGTLAIFLLLGFFFVTISPWGNSRLIMLPFPAKWKTYWESYKTSFRLMFSMKPLVIVLCLAAVAWLAEGLGLWVVLQGLDTTITIEKSVSIYAASTLFGALLMLPGGLVGTEGSMVALLQQLGVNRTIASSATFIIRLCTLWFAVLVGLPAMGFIYFFMKTSTSVKIASTTTNESQQEEKDSSV